jgi:hypothetical protein
MAAAGGISSSSSSSPSCTSPHSISKTAWPSSSSASARAAAAICSAVSPSRGLRCTASSHCFSRLEKVWL